MSTLTDLVCDRTALTPADLDWLHRLVAEWQLVADLSFSDLVLHVRDRSGGWLAVAHMRPTTGPTARTEDVVGVLAEEATARGLERAASTGRLLRAGELAREVGRPPGRTPSGLPLS